MPVNSVTREEIDAITAWTVVRAAREIARRVGYSRTSSFSTATRRAFGRSPAELRRLAEPISPPGPPRRP